jgi:hypothetical protein
MVELLLVLPHCVLVFGWPLGGFGLATLENSTSKSAVSVICRGVVHALCCGTLPSLLKMRVDIHTIAVPSGTPSLHPLGTGLE